LFTTFFLWISLQFILIQMEFFSSLCYSYVYNTSFTYILCLNSWQQPTLTLYCDMYCSGSLRDLECHLILAITCVLAIWCPSFVNCRFCVIREEISHLLNWRRIYCTSYFMFIKNTHAQTTNPLPLWHALNVTDWCLTWDYKYGLSLLPELVMYPLQMMELITW